MSNKPARWYHWILWWFYPDEKHVEEYFRRKIMSEKTVDVAPRAFQDAPAMHEWHFVAAILPADNVGGKWSACCAHPDHTAVWTSAPHTAGTAAVALEQHWRAKHVKDVKEES